MLPRYLYLNSVPYVVPSLEHIRGFRVSAMRQAKCIRVLHGSSPVWCNLDTSVNMHYKVGFDKLVTSQGHSMS